MIRVGTKVQLKGAKGKGFPWAKVLLNLKHIKNGVVLDTALAGFKMWNKSDLVRVR